MIERRLQHRLIPHILNMVPEGSIIYSDELVSYKVLGEQHNYIHKTVCHSDNEFVREETEGQFDFYVHINTAECHNRYLKSKFKNIQHRSKKRIKKECDIYNWKRSTSEFFFPFLT